ncbi:predicted protein [Lichtheimia corymbifera JMRC:FSU:9682]|uniref:Mid2 domain-containing protein n=1 Tax=Lichtheimia corymbifera JMRC:FSU:9682 TaxID=1263082 RepID=A0A068RY41_9FUNG|nr:predicted protein [Lichtheimia corymbifera JMRC:FSU:9682]
MKPLLFIAGLFCYYSPFVPAAAAFPWKRQVTVSASCASQPNTVGICSPTSNDVWYNGSYYEFTWKYNNPAYITSEDNTINLYLLYESDGTYTSVKEWKGLPRSPGSFVQQVDDSWFPSKLPDNSANKTWQPYAYVLTDGYEYQQEIENDYNFPKPVQFTLIQSAHNTSTDESDSPNGSGSANASNSGSGLPGWLIAVIVIACVVFVAALAGLLWFIRRLKRTNAQNNVAAAGAAANMRDSKTSDQRNLMQTTDASMPTIPRPFAGSISNSNDMSSIHSSTPIMASVRNAPPGSPQQSSPTKSIAEAELGNKPPTSPAVAHIMQNQEARQSSSILSSTDAIMIADTFRQFMRKPEWNEQHEEEDDDENTFKLGNEPIKQRKPLGDDLFRKNDNDADNETVHHNDNDDDRRPSRLKDSSTQE